MLLIDCEEAQNALKQYELNARDGNLRTSDQFLQLSDSYDSIDLTGNHLSELDLDSLSHLDRLKTLLVAKNFITHVKTQISVPKNLRSLSLAHNRLQSLSCLEFLSKLPKLTYLNLIGNPVTSVEGYRETVIRLQPSIRILDFEKVREFERPEKSIVQHQNDAEHHTRRQELLKKLETAESMEEVDAIELELESIN